MENFLSERIFINGPWQAFERVVARLLQHAGYTDVRIVGRSGDGGADIIAHSIYGKRFVIQVKFKHRGQGVIHLDVLDKTLEACRLYRGDIPVIATNGDISEDLVTRQCKLIKENIHIQLWNWKELTNIALSLPEESAKKMDPYPYQEIAINKIVDGLYSSKINSGLVVMATGLGKTFVAAEAANRYIASRSDSTRILVLAHTNELVYQLERSFWPFIKKSQTTAVINGNELGDISGATYVFGCIPSVIKMVNEGTFPLGFNLVIIDEAHHAGCETYNNITKYLRAGMNGGPFLLGLTATPWRSDERDLDNLFGPVIVKIDIIDGMKNGYLTNVDYRMYIPDFNWDELNELCGQPVTIKKLNQTLFISEFSNESANLIKQTWLSLPKARGVIFCRTIEHAMYMKKILQSLGFCRVEAIFSGDYHGKHLSFVDRSILMSDFADGRIGIMCAVDIFNEGIDVPDINLIVFQRVTHSRRIFVQQLGRGLRVKKGKEKVIVLDFVSDVRRVAAAVEINIKVADSSQYLSIGKPVKFISATGSENSTYTLLTEWLKDVASIQDYNENDNRLRFPSKQLLSKI